MSKKSKLTHDYKCALKTQTRFGESKHKAKVNAREDCRKENKPYEPIHGIYSTTTLQNYDKICKRFVQWIMENHRNEVKNYTDCKNFAAEWIEEKELQGLSAWSLNLYGSALASSFGGISKHDLGYSFPRRERKNIVINRNDKLTGEYATARQRNAYAMLKATGCRRREILRLRKEDFRQQLDKDGKETGYLEVRLFQKNDIPKDGIHSTRSVYACDLYKHFMELGYESGKIYHCRKELAGYSYDKGILDEVSYNMQHSRDDVVITYLWLI